MWRVVAQPGSVSRLWRDGRWPCKNVYVYVLYSSSLERYYVGSTDNVEKRLSQHNSGRGYFTGKGCPWNLITNIECKSRSEAMRLEIQIKKRGIKRYLQDHNLV